MAAVAISADVIFDIACQSRFAPLTGNTKQRGERFMSLSPPVAVV